MPSIRSSGESAGSASETSANRGVPPIAATSLRLTAIARQPTSSGEQVLQVKWTPSTCMSQVATADPMKRSTAASSPIPSTTPGALVGTSRRNRSIRPNSPTEASGSPQARTIDLLPDSPRRARHILRERDRGDDGDALGAGSNDRAGVVRSDADDGHDLK